MSRESFVFHFEYLDGMPEEIQPVYAMHAIRYARDGVEPEFDDWRDEALWARIKARIDADNAAWEETVNARIEAGKRGGQKSGETRRKQAEEHNEAMLQDVKQNEANEAMLQDVKQNEANEAMLQDVKQNEANEAVSVSVFDSVTVSEHEFEFGSSSAPEQKTKSPPLSPPGTTTTVLIPEKSPVEQRLKSLGYNFDESALQRISDAISSAGQSCDLRYLDYMDNALRNKMFRGVMFGDKPPEERCALYLTAITSWTEYRNGYDAWLAAQKLKARMIRKNSPPEVCPECKGEVRSAGTVCRCGKCGNIYEFKGGDWVKSDSFNPNLSLADMVGGSLKKLAVIKPPAPELDVADIY